MTGDPYDRRDPKSATWADDLEDRVEQEREGRL